MFDNLFTEFDILLPLFLKITSFLDWTRDVWGHGPLASLAAFTPRSLVCAYFEDFALVFKNTFSVNKNELISEKYAYI